MMCASRCGPQVLHPQAHLQKRRLSDISTNTLACFSPPQTIKFKLVPVFFMKKKKSTKTTMAATSFLSLSPSPSSSSSFTKLSSNQPRNSRRASNLSVLRCSLNPSSVETEKPQIELEFIGPKAGADGSFPVDKAQAISGEKLLRNIMLDNKIELYAAYGKVMNCGGGGSCGTCIVEIVDGKDLLNERTDTEKRYLKKKPESWRLACQTIVGNKENAGKVVVQRLPQWKK